METNLLDRMLEVYLTGQTSVTMSLQNSIRVSGRIKAFDSYVIVMEGQKHEIVYRHAVSSIAPNSEIDQKRRPPIDRIKTTSSKPEKPVRHKARTAQIQASASPGETPNLNNTMKDGLLKWMQEQNAAK
jgi:host factor-I protein